MCAKATAIILPPVTIIQIGAIAVGCGAVGIIAGYNAKKLAENTYDLLSPEDKQFIKESPFL